MNVDGHLKQSDRCCPESDVKFNSYIRIIQIHAK
jgi:hypothetical protein